MTDAQMGPDVLRLLPEALLLAGALAVLVGGSFLPRKRLGATRVATAVILLGSAVIAIVSWPVADQAAFSHRYLIDPATAAVRVIATLGAGLIVLAATPELRRTARQAELCCLVLLATLGTVVLAGANDLLLIITGFLLASIPLYAIVAMAFTSQAAEAAMKTYFYGSLFGIVLMLGVVVLYGVGDSTELPALAHNLATAPERPTVVGAVAVLGGLMFKAGGVPGHFWIPDAAQGAGSLAATFLTTIPKIGAVVAVYRLVLVLPAGAHALLLVGILAVLSMLIGNLAAFFQDDPRRLLGWSTVSQVGYLLVPAAVAGRSDLSLAALVVYLAGYVATNIAAFTVSAALPQLRSLDGYRGLGHRDPWLAGALIVGLLGLVGTPPAAVFVGKLSVATAAWDGAAAWLTIAVIANSVLSLFYYLRWIIPTVARATGTAPQPQPHRWPTGIAITAAALTLVVGIGADMIFHVIGR
jgi:NADH-quinone oxidoreductase subunit N